MKRQSAGGLFLGAILTAIVTLTFCLWGTTQYVAHWFDYQSGLGEPRFNLFGWSVYDPWAYFLWMWNYYTVPGTAELWNDTLHFLAIVSHALALIGIGFAIYRARKVSGSKDNNSSAHWQTKTEIRQSGLIGNTDGVIVGGWEDPKGIIHYLRHNGPEHVIGFAPSQIGKGVSLVIPTLLTWRESAVIYDPKGENWAVTSGWAAQVGIDCLRFDPTCTDGTATRYNMLQEIRQGIYETRDAQEVAETLVDPMGEENRQDRHWDPSAKALLTGVILHVLYTQPNKTIAGCLHFLTNPKRPIRETLNAMLRSPQITAARSARAMLNKSDPEMSGIVSTAVRCLRLWEDPIVVANTEMSDFYIRDLMNNDRPVRLYITTPPSDIDRLGPLVRTLLNQIGRRVTQQMAFDEGEKISHYRHRLLLMMDEFPVLGKLNFFQSEMAYFAGYGIKCFLICQDLAQLYATYGKNESITSNCHIRTAFTPNRWETAELLSKMTGQATVKKPTRTYTGGRLEPMLMHVIASEQESSRPLLRPDEVLRLPAPIKEEEKIVEPGDMLIFIAGQYPIYGKQVLFFQDPVLLERSRIPPPTHRGTIPSEASPWDQVETIIDEKDEPEEADIVLSGADLI